MSFNSNPSQLSQEQILQQVFDPANQALRTDAFVQVDTINADLTVDIKASSGDNIAIADKTGTNYLTVNPDGSINVNLDSTAPSIVNNYNEITSVGNGILTTILTTTASQASSLILAEVAGTNIAQYVVSINSSVICKAYTFFGGNLTYFFDFKSGIHLNPGDIITVSVLHNRPYVGDFNARIEIAA